MRQVPSRLRIQFPERREHLVPPGEGATGVKQHSSSDDLPTMRSRAAGGSSSRLLRAACCEGNSAQNVRVRRANRASMKFCEPPPACRSPRKAGRWWDRATGAGLELTAFPSPPQNWKRMVRWLPRVVSDDRESTVPTLYQDWQARKDRLTGLPRKPGDFREAELRLLPLSSCVFTAALPKRRDATRFPHRARSLSTTAQSSSTPTLARATCPKSVPGSGREQHLRKLVERMSSRVSSNDADAFHAVEGAGWKKRNLLTWRIKVSRRKGAWIYQVGQIRTCPAETWTCPEKSWTSPENYGQ